MNPAILDYVLLVALILLLGVLTGVAVRHAEQR